MKKSSFIVNAVIGYPLGHTRSPALHAAAYRLLGINAAMVPLSDPDVKKLVQGIRALPFTLTAVTMPFKTSIIPLLDRLDAAAKRLSAVNTVLKTGGKLMGYNTDIDGIRYALRSVRLKGKNVLLIGAGGAARAVASVIDAAGGELMYLNRTKERASALMKEFGGTLARLGELTANDVDVIVNATPIGMHPRASGMPLPERFIAKHQAVFDLVYNPVKTRLLTTAAKKGARIISGLDMFVVQGLRQVELMSGRTLVNPRSVARIAKNLMKTNI